MPLVLKAGGCRFHHGHLLHCSYPNLSDKRRRGYATHYVSARCRYVGPEQNPTFPLIRGRAFPGLLVKGGGSYTASEAGTGFKA